jgi:hypothetical protein
MIRVSEKGLLGSAARGGRGIDETDRKDSATATHLLT